MIVTPGGGMSTRGTEVAIDEIRMIGGQGVAKRRRSIFAVFAIIRSSGSKLKRK
jgi:hypothetical protein